MKELIKDPIALAVSTLISEDLAYIYGLFSVQSHELESHHFVLFYSLGVIVGDFLLYGLGVVVRKYSSSLLGKKIKKFLEKKEAKYKSSKRDDFGAFEEFLVFTRFLPGSRIPTYIYCGLTSYSPLRFFIILFVTSLLYTTVGIFLIKQLEGFDLLNSSFLEKLLLAILVTGITISAFKSIILIRQLKLKYRKVLKPLWVLFSRYKYLEFWPIYLFYLPFVPYFTFLLLKHRGFSSALSSNPALSMSGFIGELKSDIDKLLINYLPSKRLKLLSIKKSDFSLFESKLEDEDLDFPLILKPDSGMRGTGVMKVQNGKELTQYISQANKDLIIQEYCEYEKEWGVFYYRMPEQKEGKIFSITNKQFPSVIGDGSKNLFELCMKDHFVSNRFNWIFNKDNLDPLYVPKKDEEVQLVQRGSHSKGCIFRDGAQWVESNYVKEVRKDLDKIPGFHIGRVDIRFPSLVELEKGNYKILEINGAGGESSNFYDPELSRLKVYEIMKKQWDLIFKIGYLNKEKGLGKESTLDLLKTMLRYRKGVQ